MIFQVIIFPADFYAKTRSLPFPSVTEHWFNPKVWAVYIPPAMGILGSIALIGIARRKFSAMHAGLPPRDATLQDRHLTWTILSLIILILIFMMKGMVRVSDIHMIMAIIASVMLLGVMRQRIADLGTYARLATRSVSWMIAAPTIMILLQMTALDAQNNIRWATHHDTWKSPSQEALPEDGTCNMPPGLQHLACTKIDPATVEAIRYVQARTSPADPIFVGLSRHDKIYINDILFYFSAQRRSATKWHHFDPGLQTSAPIQREMVAELQHARPKLIVLVDRWNDVKQPNDSAISSGVTILDDYIDRMYEPAASFGPYSILRFRSADTS